MTVTAPSMISRNPVCAGLIHDTRSSGMRELTYDDREAFTDGALALVFCGETARRYDAVKKRILRAVPTISEKAHQRAIREREAANEPRAALESLEDCWVERITTADAKAIIDRYEWLGTMGRAVAAYGLISPDKELLGVAVFGWPSAIESRDVCGRDNRELAVCLERGACVHFAPDNAASFLISRAVKLAADEHGWRIFYAYADPEAGEIGTVYQACNWLYIGQGVGRTPGRLREDWRLPDGSILSSRSLRHRKMKRADAYALGWEPIYRHPKHKYVHFEGNRTERTELLRALRYAVKDYPKRGSPPGQIEGLAGAE